MKRHPTTFSVISGSVLIASALLTIGINRSTQASIMEEVIVTATRTDKVLLDNPYSVSLITKEQIEINPADQIAEYINDLPGIYISDAGQAGFKRIRIRGEEARRMAFLVDGQEFMDHREVGVPLLVDPASIERIEIVKGPASVLYGPKAMGGVINVITDTDISEPLSGSFSMSLDSATSGSYYAAGLSGASGPYQWRISLLDNEQKDRDTPAGEIENTSYESDGVSLTLKRLNQQSGVALGYEDFNSNSEVYVEPEVRFSFPFVDFRIDAPQRDREKLRLNYEHQISSKLIDNIELSAYRQVSDRQFNTFPSVQIAPFLPRTDTEIFTTSRLISDALNTQINWLANSDHRLITGIQYLHDQIEQDRHREVFVSDALTTVEDNFDDAENQTIALYIQDDWRINEVLSFLMGIRYYKVDGKLNKSNRFTQPVNFDDDHRVASVALVYSPRDNLSYRFNYSQGYIFPSLLNLVIGAYAGPRYINPDAELKPETSDTYELGLRYTNEHWTLDTTLFQSGAKDYIDHLFCQAADNCLTPSDKIYRNIGEANSHGAEITLLYSTDNIDFYNHLTWLRRKKEYEGVSSYQSGVPAVTGRLGVTYTSNGPDFPFAVDIYSRYQSDTEEIELQSSGLVLHEHDKWITLNADFSLRTGRAYILNMTLGNITNRKYSTATENLYAPKRHVRLKFVARF